MNIKNFLITVQFLSVMLITDGFSANSIPPSDESNISSQIIPSDDWGKNEIRNEIRQEEENSEINIDNMFSREDFKRDFRKVIMIQNTRKAMHRYCNLIRNYRKKLYLQKKDLKSKSIHESDKSVSVISEAPLENPTENCGIKEENKRLKSTIEALQKQLDASEAERDSLKKENDKNEKFIREMHKGIGTLYKNVQRLFAVPTEKKGKKEDASLSEIFELFSSSDPESIDKEESSCPIV